MGDIELQIFADRLKELRSSLGITQAEFVEGLGITPAALSAYENNQKNPSISVAKRIAEKYNISIDWLCGLSNQRERGECIKTYADMFRLIIRLCNIQNVFGEWEIEFIDDDTETHAFPEKGVAYSLLRSADQTTAKFFKDWVQMYALYKNCTIDQHLYDLWLSDKLKQYEKEYIESDLPFN